MTSPTEAAPVIRDDYTTPYLCAPRRSLDDVRLDLITRRLQLMQRQLEAEAAGNQADAAWCERETERLARQLRMLDAARGGRCSAAQRCSTRSCSSRLL